MIAFHIRAKIIIYDLVKDVRFTVTPEWDRSAGQLTVRLIYNQNAFITIIPISSRSFRHLATT